MEINEWVNWEAKKELKTHCFPLNNKNSWIILEFVTGIQRVSMKWSYKITNYYYLFNIIIIINLKLHLRQ